MFPLGTVLVPGALLPLHVFEDRYRALVRDVLAGDGEFGVVLIERGSEVGGGDTRSSWGTVARVIRSEELQDGRWALIAAGERRLRVVEWLDDDPYPRALIRDWPDEELADADLTGGYAAARSILSTALGLASELGHRVPATTTAFPSDPEAGSFMLVAMAPIASFDQQRLLGASTTAARLELLQTLLAEEVASLRAQLEMGTG